MKKSSTVIAAIVFFISIFNTPGVARATLLQPGHVNVLEQKGSLIEGAALFFSNWLKNEKAGTHILKTKDLLEKSKKATRMPLLGLEQQLNAHRLVSRSA